MTTTKRMPRRLKNLVWDLCAVSFWGPSIVTRVNIYSDGTWEVEGYQMTRVSDGTWKTGYVVIASGKE